MDSADGFDDVIEDAESVVEPEESLEAAEVEPEPEPDPDENAKSSSKNRRKKISFI